MQAAAHTAGCGRARAGTHQSCTQRIHGVKGGTRARAGGLGWTGRGLLGATAGRVGGRACLGPVPRLQVGQPPCPDNSPINLCVLPAGGGAGVPHDALRARPPLSPPATAPSPRCWGSLTPRCEARRGSALSADSSRGGRGGRLSGGGPGSRLLGCGQGCGAGRCRRRWQGGAHVAPALHHAPQGVVVHGEGDVAVLRDHVQGQDGVVGRRDDIVHPGRPHGHAEAEHGRVPVCTGLQQVGAQARPSATSQGMQSEEALGRVTWLKGLLQRIVQLRVVLGPVHTEAVGPVVACS